MDANKVTHLSSHIRGYQIYNAIWDAIYAVREELQCAREVENVKDGYVISILQDSDVLDHLPQRFLNFAQVAVGISNNTF